MPKRHKLEITVVDQVGRCHHGHKIGDKWIINKGETPTGDKGICLAAYGTLHPMIYAMLWGLSFPWEEDPYSITLGCPDTVNHTTWKIRRIEE